MSDPCDYHTIDHKVLDAQTLAQLKDLRASLDDRIDALKKAKLGGVKLATEISQEIVAEGPTSITVTLQVTLSLLRDYFLYKTNVQEPENRPEVYAFITRIRESINSKMTTERLEAAGLTEANRREVENLVLERIR